LVQGTQYFFRAVGINSTDTITGDTLNFVTIIPGMTVTPPNRIVGTPAGNTQFFVTSNVNWTVTSDASWCTVTPSGNGNDTIVATFTENTSVIPRVALITVTGDGGITRTVTVSQDGIPVILEVTPPNREVSSNGGNTSFYVTSNTNWNVSVDSTWITATPSGQGNDSILVNVAGNMATTSRIGTITVSATGAPSVSVTVTQSRAPLMLDVTPPNQNVSAQAGNTSFTVTSNAPWHVISDAPWCTVTAGGSGNGTIVADFAENVAHVNRTANISVSLDSLLVKTVTVIQAKSTLGINDPGSESMKIYPNPTKGNFKIVPANGVNEVLNVQIIDMNGKIILEKIFRGEKEYDVSLSSSPSGNYQIIIKTDKDLVVRNLVITK
jgi:hypothetical protein